MKFPPTPLRALVSLVFWRLVISLRGLRYRIVDASQVSQRELTRIDACFSVASSLSLIDPVCGNLFHARNLLITLRAGEPKRVARALAIEVSYRGTAGGPGWAKTKALERESRRVASELGDQFTTAWSTATSAVAHYLSGYFEEALAMCKEAEQTFVEQVAGTTWEAFSMRLFTLQSLAHLGRFGELRTRQESALRSAIERGDLYAAVNLRIGYPNLAWLVAGDPAAARREATEAMQQWSTRGFHLEHYFELLALTNADLYEGRSRDAYERITSLWQPLRRSLLTRVQLVRLNARNMRARAAIATAEAEPASRAQLLAARGEGNEGGRARGDAVDDRHVAPHSRGCRPAPRRRGCAHVTLLESAIAEGGRAKLALIGAGARYALGTCKGGDEGTALVADALAGDEGGRGETDPEGLFAMVAPGFGAAAGAAGRDRRAAHSSDGARETRS